MKKIIILLILLIGIFTLVGCENKKDNKSKENVKIKNPKIVSIKGKNGTTKFKYDNDDTFEETKTESSIMLTNSENNFRLFFEYSTKSIEEHETQKEKYKKDNTYEVIEDVNFNGYKSFVFIDKKYGTVRVFSYLDEKNDIVMITKISAVRSNDALKEIEDGKEPVDVIYKQKKVQRILKSMKYTKNK